MTKKFAAAAILLLAASSAASAQTGQIIGGKSQTTCDERGNCQSTTTYERAPAPVEPFRRGPGSREDVYIMLPKASSQKPAAVVSDLCPRPYRMTEMDGCQLPGRR